jgi:cobalamin biosynthesis Mg chelatase CobN
LKTKENLTKLSQRIEALQREEHLNKIQMRNI